MTYISYVSLVDALAIIAVLVVVFVSVIMYFATNQNRVGPTENLDDGEKRNKYGETREMFELRVSRYWEELRQIEKRQNHLMKLIRISTWKPR